MYAQNYKLNSYKQNLENYVDERKELSLRIFLYGI